MLKNILIIVFLSLFFGAEIYTYSYYVKLQSCPAGYIELPDQGQKMCLAKYEMKKDSKGEAVSQAKGLPWVDLSRQEAIDACKSNGSRYNLIDNTTWTSVARFIAVSPESWSANKQHEGQLNLGNAFDKPGKTLEASTNDDEACYLTGTECSHVEWNVHNRTHTLPNGEIIWDFSGNVAELTKDRLQAEVTIESNFIKFLEFKRPPLSMFAPEENCTGEGSDKEKKHCGFGKFVSTKGLVGASITRGGYWGSTSGEDAGIFSTMLTMKDNDRSPKVGFRCTFEPAQKISSFKELLTYIQSR